VYDHTHIGVTSLQRIRNPRLQFPTFCMCHTSSTSTTSERSVPETRADSLVSSGKAVQEKSSCDSKCAVRIKYWLQVFTSSCPQAKMGASLVLWCFTCLQGDPAPDSTTCICQACAQAQCNIDFHLLLNRKKKISVKLPLQIFL